MGRDGPMARPRRIEYDGIVYHDTGGSRHRGHRGVTRTHLLSCMPENSQGLTLNQALTREIHSQPLTRRSFGGTSISYTHQEWWAQPTLRDCKHASSSKGRAARFVPRRTSHVTSVATLSFLIAINQLS